MATLDSPDMLVALIQASQGVQITHGVEESWAHWDVTTFEMGHELTILGDDITVTCVASKISADEGDTVTIDGGTRQPDVTGSYVVRKRRMIEDGSQVQLSMVKAP